MKDYLPNLSESYGLQTYKAWENNSLNNEYDVYFLGFVNNPYKFISRSKLFLFPSISEGLGNALIEAMACGTPVISPDCITGPCDILAPDNDYNTRVKTAEYTPYGVLMPVFDGLLKDNNSPLTNEEKIWIETSKELLNNTKKSAALAANGLKRTSYFDADKIMTEWIEVINE